MTLIVCCVFDVVALALGSWLLWRRPWRSAWRDAIGLLCLAALAVFAVTLLTRPGGGFAMLRGWAHATFCVVLPLVMVRAVRVWRHCPRLSLAALLLALFGEGCYVWAREVEPFRLEVTTQQIKSKRLAALNKPVRVAVVADLQSEAITSYEVSVFDRLVEAKPDLVLFLGDYLQVRPEVFKVQLPLLHEQLRRLSPPLGMFAVEGDVDGEHGGAEVVFRGTAVKTLTNESAVLPGVPIVVHGLDRTRARAPFVNAPMVQRLHGECYPIVFGHAPDFMQSVLRGGLQAEALLVAGHTHGGQVQIPGFGPPMALTSVPRWLAGGGVFQRGETWLCCSRGIGMERDEAPRIRFWCRPQLILLDLSSA